MKTTKFFENISMFISVLVLTSIVAVATVSVIFEYEKDNKNISQNLDNKEVVIYSNGTYGIADCMD